jgi:hypothetical protein
LKEKIATSALEMIEHHAVMSPEYIDEQSTQRRSWWKYPEEMLIKG